MFYWPVIRKVAADYCHCFHTCQMIGESGQLHVVAPLQPLPAFGESFSKNISDCVGPLSQTNSGNQFIFYDYVLVH